MFVVGFRVFRFVNKEVIQYPCIRKVRHQNCLIIDIRYNAGDSSIHFCCSLLQIIRQDMLISQSSILNEINLRNTGNLRFKSTWHSLISAKRIVVGKHPRSQYERFAPVWFNTHYYNSNLIWRTVSRRVGEVIPSDHPRRNEGDPMVWPHPRDAILYARSSYFYNNMFIICIFILTLFWFYKLFWSLIQKKCRNVCHYVLSRHIYVIIKIWRYIIMFCVSGSMLEI